MPDTPKVNSPDNQRVALKDHDEVRTWCRSFDCDEATLRAARQAAGTDSAEAVQAAVRQIQKVRAFTDEK